MECKVKVIASQTSCLSPLKVGGMNSVLIGKEGRCRNVDFNNLYYYTSRENTLIPLDESHVSRLLATCVSVDSVTAGATQGLAPAIK